MATVVIRTPEEQRNANALKLAFEAYNRSDAGPLLALLAENVRFGIAAPREHLRFAGVDQGIGWARRVLAEIAEDFEWLNYQNRDLLVDGDWVIALNGGKIRDRESGAVLDADLVDVVRFKDGKIVQFIEYFDTTILTAITAARAKLTAQLSSKLMPQAGPKVRAKPRTAAEGRTSKSKRKAIKKRRGR